MPKIGNVEFKLGRKSGYRTDLPNKELMLHYEVKYDHFYFKAEQVKEVFPAITNPPKEHDYRGCRTKESAMNIIQTLVDDEIKPIKMLSIRVKVAQRLLVDMMIDKTEPIKDQKTFNKLRKDKAVDEYNHYGESHESALGIELERYLVFKFPDGNDVIRRCDKRWYVSDRYHTHTMAGALMEWTQEREDFILDTLGKIDQMGLLIINWLVDGMHSSGMDFGRFLDMNGGLTLGMGEQAKTE